MISRPLHGQLVTYPPQKKFRLRRPGWGWPLLTKNSCYRGRMNCLIWHKKHDIFTQRVHTKIHFTKLLFTGEEFMVLENIIGEKFMIPWKNIHPWLYAKAKTRRCKSMMPSFSSLRQEGNLPGYRDIARSDTPGCPDER